MLNDMFVQFNNIIKLNKLSNFLNCNYKNLFLKEN
jgi:hypothetical protein